MPEPTSPIPVQVNLRVPEAIRLGVYADYLRVSYTEHAFILDFAQLPPPVDVPPAASGHAPSIDAPVVARVLVPRDLLPRIIVALQQNWQLRETNASGQPKTG
ncbi:MAG: DUF3467 domain-containing protein [Bacteroidetes bacterium]|nr:DUF3467 domain-containing protein [Bacteroidota bacterium]MCL5024996.1 DUF3467 domain-containing protein [Chloroflexota bacterium]